jgi:hypothetical protein
MGPSSYDKIKVWLACHISHFPGTDTRTNVVGVDRHPSESALRQGVSPIPAGIAH